jgi:hypothetical protein
MQEFTVSFNSSQTILRTETPRVAILTRLIRPGSRFRVARCLGVFPPGVSPAACTYLPYLP